MHGNMGLVGLAPPVGGCRENGSQHFPFSLLFSLKTAPNGTRFWPELFEMHCGPWRDMSPRPHQYKYVYFAQWSKNTSCVYYIQQLC